MVTDSAEADAVTAVETVVAMTAAYGSSYFYFSEAVILSVEITVVAAAVVILAANLLSGRASTNLVGVRPFFFGICNISLFSSYILITQYLGASMETTPFDSRTNSPTLQMMKLLIPYLPPKNQKILAIYIKFMEFQNTLSSFRVFRTKSFSTEDMINELRPYLPSEIFDSIDMALNMMEMMEAMKDMPEQGGDTNA